MQLFANNSVKVMINGRLVAATFFCVMPDKQIRAYSKYFQIKTNVQTACESHDLNMDYHSFDNGFKQLCVTIFMQEYGPFCIMYQTVKHVQ